MGRKVSKYDGMGFDEATIKKLEARDKLDKTKGNIVSKVNSLHESDASAANLMSLIDALNDYATARNLSGRFSYNDNGKVATKK